MRCVTEYPINKHFFIFTDGSVIGNPGPAGWAAVVINGARRQEIAGSVPWLTVSEMELRAAVEGLRLTPAGARIELRSDSELLIDGMRLLVFCWPRFGWRNSRGFELQHQELWRELLQLNELRTIRWRWVRGHNCHPIQSRADALAYQAPRAIALQERIAA
jgi:ribonuclease HI